MADKAGGMLPMDRFDADFHGAADIAVSPDNYAPLRNLADIERMERVPFEARAPAVELRIDPPGRPARPHQDGVACVAEW